MKSARHEFVVNLRKEELYQLFYEKRLKMFLPKQSQNSNNDNDEAVSISTNSEDEVFELLALDLFSIFEP